MSREESQKSGVHESVFMGSAALLQGHDDSFGAPGPTPGSRPATRSRGVDLRVPQPRPVQASRAATGPDLGSFRQDGPGPVRLVRTRGLAPDGPAAVASFGAPQRVAL